MTSWPRCKRFFDAACGQSYQEHQQWGQLAQEVQGEHSQLICHGDIDRNFRHQRSLVEHYPPYLPPEVVVPLRGAFDCAAGLGNGSSIDSPQDSANCRQGPQHFDARFTGDHAHFMIRAGPRSNSYNG